MLQEHFYDVELIWNSDRKGTMHSKVLNTSIEVATPPEFPKGMHGIWSPEHLFVAAINRSLMTTFLAIAENSRLIYKNFESKAIGKLEFVDGKYIMSEVILKPVVSLSDENDREKALKVLNKSEAACLISNSVKSKIIMKPAVQVEEFSW